MLRKSTAQAKLITAGTCSRANLSAFEGSPLAFRNYATSFEGSSLSLSSDLLNSQPVSSSRLLLDGSCLSSSGQGFSTFDHDESAPITDSSDRRPVQSPTDTTSKIPQELSILTSSPHENIKKISSLRGLGKQLVDNEPDSYTKHISSVFRYSSSNNSWRSSLASFSSRTSSILSKLSDHHKSLTGATGTRLFQNVDSTLLPDSHTSVWVQEIWNELVDEERLDCRPSYMAISPLNRKCCAPEQSAFLFCGTCGFSSEHRRAIESGIINYGNTKLVNQLDFFRNTPLHCAAASAKPYEFWKIIKMIDWGAHYHVRNTSGETFLHLLCKTGLRIATDNLDFISIIRQLSKNKFPLMLPDFHGRTPLHNLFQHVDILKKFHVRLLSEILSIMNPQLNAVDNSGISVRSLLDVCISRRAKSDEDIKPAARLSYEKSLHSPQYQFQLELNSLGAADDLMPWFGKICQSTGPAWIDTLGDTPLTALLKSQLLAKQNDNSMRGIVESMVNAGAEIHIRDRNGDTALAISARRGFRSVVDLLLERGSNIHCRNYRGVGILGQTMESMRQAFGNDRLWTMIYNCHMALVDAGATDDPTDQDEWMVPASERQS